jgi:hypothetical protein
MKIWNMLMKHNVFATFVRYHTGIWIPQKLHKVQENKCDYFRENSPCLFIDRPFFIFM